MISFLPPQSGAVTVNEAIRLNLHCHSHFSDGEFSPEELAERLAAAGVRVAALTDHDTAEGGDRFQKSLSKRGVGIVSGAELTVSGPDGEELHLLAYGFDPQNLEVQRLLSQIAATRNARTRSDSQSRPWAFDKSSENERRPGNGGIPIERAIRVIHEAGGLTFLAHPVAADLLQIPESLKKLVAQLKLAGLDGIEAFYAGSTSRISEALIALAQAEGLLISGGSDFHGREGPGSPELAINFPVVHWRRFRNALLKRKSNETAAAVPLLSPERRPLPGSRRGSFLLRIVFPALLAISLFVVSLFWVLIPSFEDRLLERKRHTIRELTNVAFSVLSEYEVEVRQGRISEEEARRAAAARIQDLRYGDEGKDYFWVTDLHPRMVMHPYRTDLNGQDLTGFQDPLGSRIFVEIVNALKNRDEAYVQYVWQWKDNPERLEPKQSFIKKFEPWGWIVGTGLYLDDVHREIGVMTARLIQISAGITVLCALLLTFVAVQSRRIERRRQAAEEELHESHEKYRTLVESVTEGTLMVLEGRPTFANPKMLEMLDYREDELGLLDLADIFPEETLVGDDGNSLAGALSLGMDIPRFLQTVMAKRGGDKMEAALTATKISFAGREGFVLAVRDTGSSHDRESILHQAAIEREHLIGELQASLFFLHEPAAHLAGAPLFIDMQIPVSKAAALITAADTSAAVVTASDEPVGIITDHDLRARVLAADHPIDPPVFQVMTSPLITIDEQALVYEAILTMREKNVDHLPVRGEGGRITGVLRNRELLLFHRYSLAVLTQEIRHARSAEEIAKARAGLPKFVKALTDGGAKARNITRAITSVTDAIVVRLIELGIEKLGSPPARFAFLALGSQGREEQTLTADQDHALIFEDVREQSMPAVQAYFVALGQFVSSGMAAAGYAICPGKIMANNPRWCQPLQSWKRVFSDWLQTAEPQHILDLQIFFDFRTVFGTAEYSHELRRHIDEVLAQEPPFLLHYAQYCLQYKSPIGFFGHLVLGGGKDGPRKVQIKEAIMPVVNFARLYAFRHGVRETNTLDRLRKLLELGELKGTLPDETMKAYDYVMQLRLAWQGRAAERGLAPTNEIDPKELAHLEEGFLKQAFVQIAAIQKKISYDFLGSV
jgi:PAS domain S-box-containing protein